MLQLIVGCHPSDTSPVVRQVDLDPTTEGLWEPRQPPHRAGDPGNGEPQAGGCADREHWD